MQLRLGCALSGGRGPKQNTHILSGHGGLYQHGKNGKENQNTWGRPNRKCGEWAEHVLVGVLPGQENSTENYFAPFLVITLSVTP